MESNFTIVEIFKRMVPRHELEFLSLVLLALPASLVATLQEQNQGRDEAELWATIAEIGTNNAHNLDVAIEVELLSNAFNGHD